MSPTTIRPPDDVAAIAGGAPPNALKDWDDLRHLLGAHPRQSINDAAQRVLRDAMPGPARAAATVIIVDSAEHDPEPWDTIRRALEAGRAFQ